MDWQTGSNDKLAGVCNNLIHFEHVAFVVGSTATCESLSTLATTTICVGRVQRRTECVAPTCLTHPTRASRPRAREEREETWCLIALHCIVPQCTTPHCTTAHSTKLVYTSQHGQACELCSACEVAGVLRLNYQLLGASYADEPYMGGMAGLYKGEEKRRN